MFPSLVEARDAIKRATTGRATDEDEELLVTLGFGRRAPSTDSLLPHPWMFAVTSEGNDFDLALNVYRDTDEATRLFRDGYLKMEYTQVLIQSLHGRGSIPVVGGLHLLARHGVGAGLPSTEFRKLLIVLNSLGLVAYSKKDQSFRVSVTGESGEDDEPGPDLRVIDLDRPFSNRKQLREVLAECVGYIWWADPHFDKAGLDPLVEIADATRIDEIRILTGSKPPPADVTNVYAPFGAEMRALGIAVEVRHVAKPDLALHDRFIIGKSVVWNVPPIGVVTGKGSYSQFTRVDERPPFDEWWAKGSPIDGA